VDKELKAIFKKSVLITHLKAVLSVTAQTVSGGELYQRMNESIDVRSYYGQG